MRKMICFDMDGTIANLYGVSNWLSDLRNENTRPYRIAEPMWDMVALTTILNMLKNEGWEIRIITWLAKGSTDEYKNQVRETKKEWLDRYNFPYDTFHGIQYGTTKANSVRNYTDYAILIDDDDKVRKGWALGDTINPTTENIIDILGHLL